MEIEADHRAADAKALDQDAGDEFLRGQFGERGVEGEHDRAVEPGCRKQPQLGRLVGQPEQLFARIEEHPRMRLEGQYRGRPVQLHRAPLRGRDHGLVAAMHAVEIADGDDRAAQRGIARAVAHDAKVLWRHRCFDG